MTEDCPGLLLHFFFSVVGYHLCARHYSPNLSLPFLLSFPCWVLFLCAALKHQHPSRSFLFLSIVPTSSSVEMLSVHLSLVYLLNLFTRLYHHYCLKPHGPTGVVICVPCCTASFLLPVSAPPDLWCHSPAS